MDVSLRQERKILKGMSRGFLVGGGIGAALGLSSGDDPPGFFSSSAEDKAIMGAALFGAVGTIVGFVVGAVTEYDVWGPVVPDARSRLGVSLAPVTGGRGGPLGVGLSIRLR